jgi:hypothetical protein
MNKIVSVIILSLCLTACTTKDEARHINAKIIAIKQPRGPDKMQPQYPIAIVRLPNGEKHRVNLYTRKYNIGDTIQLRTSWLNTLIEE